MSQHPPSRRPSLTEDQRAQLTSSGHVRLPGAIPDEDVALMRERMWEALAAGGADRNDPSTWRVVDRQALKVASQQGAFDRYASPTVVGAVDSLLGPENWVPPARWGLPMVTFPEVGRSWDVPSIGWHLDGSPRFGPAEGLVRTFALLDHHEPGGGATLVVAGSHRLVARFAPQITARPKVTGSVAARRALVQAHSWFADLFDPRFTTDRPGRFMGSSAIVDGVEVRVVEFAGQPGDVFLMHPWSLHAAAPCCGPRPRMMLMSALMRSDPPPPYPPARRG